MTVDLRVCCWLESFQENPILPETTEIHSTCPLALSSVGGRGPYPGELPMTRLLCLTWLIAGIVVTVHSAHGQGRRRSAESDRAPRVGQPAPDFALPVQGSKKTVRLSDLVQDKPVVLAFGSYT